MSALLRLGNTAGTESGRGGKPADKPGSVRALRPMTAIPLGRGLLRWLKPPTRKLGGSRRRLPIWCCSGWRLPRFTSSSSRALDR